MQLNELFVLVLLVFTAILSSVLAYKVTERDVEAMKAIALTRSVPVRGTGFPPDIPVMEEMTPSFEKELQHIINKHGIDAKYDTPDYALVDNILAFLGDYYDPTAVYLGLEQVLVTEQVSCAQYPTAASSWSSGRGFVPPTTTVQAFNHSREVFLDDHYKEI